MKDTKHTPGPWAWHYIDDQAKNRLRGVDGVDGRKVCTFHGALYRGSLRRPSAEIIANARLIAAAPELLDAVKACALQLESEAENYRDDNESGGDPYQPHAKELQRLVDIARAAIAKATGDK